MAGDFKSDVSVFFQNMMPVLKIRGRSIGVIHDLIPFRIPDVLVNDCKWFTRESLKCYCRKHEYLAHHADKVVTVSEYSRREIAKEFGLAMKDIAVVPNGVDFKRFAKHDGIVQDDNLVRQKYKLPERFILYFGTTAKYKNVENLIRGYSRMPEIVRRCVSLVITNGSDELRRVAADCGVLERVVFLTFVPEEDKPSIYRLASAFAFLSRYEGFGIPPLEAMAAGVPVLVSNCTTLPEVVGDAALVVDPDDIDGVADSLESMLEDGDVRNRLICNGHNRAAKFTWDAAGIRMSEVIDSL